MQLFAAGLLLSAWCGPQLCSTEALVRRNHLDIAYVLDVSNSMLAKDVTPDRLRRARQEMLSISRGFGKGRSGLVLFAGSAVVQCPLTTDRQVFEMMLFTASPDLLETQGTDIGKALDMADGMLSVAGNDERIQGARAIILASDGEDHERALSGVARKLQNKDVKLVVMGIGEEKPAPIPLNGLTGDSLNVKRDAGGRPVLTSFSSETLRLLADDAGGLFLHSNRASTVSEDVLEILNTIESDEQWVREPRFREEVYQFFVMGSLLLLLGAGFVAKTQGAHDNV